MSNEIKPEEKPFDLGAVVASLAEEMKRWKCMEKIPFPVEVASVEIAKSRDFSKIPVGQMCAVKAVDDDKSRLGFYLGELPSLGLSGYCYNAGEKKLRLTVSGNPALYVPSLNRVVWGYESWWTEINDPSQVDKLTEDEIDKTRLLVLSLMAAATKETK